MTESPAPEPNEPNECHVSRHGAHVRRRWLLRAVLGMAALGLLALLGVLLQSARGPARDVRAPSIRTARLAAQDHLWADAPAAAPGLPAHPEGGARLGGGLSLKVLLLRLPDGRLRAFHAIAVQGVPTLPLGQPPASLMSAGVPCLDFSPDFGRGDIACRQASPGFEFALRHRWGLDGQPLTEGTTPLPVAQGREVDGDWVPDAP